MDDIRPDITATEARNEAIATVLRSLDSILSSGYELSCSGIIIREADAELVLSLDEVTYRCGDRDTETQCVTFTFDELADPTLDLNALTKQRWQAASVAAAAAARATQIRMQAEEAEKAALGKRKAKEAREARAAALKLAETKDPALIAALREAGVINS